MTKTEVVTRDGEFAYPPIEHVRDRGEEVWIRTSDGSVKLAECTLQLYKMKSFTKKEKDMFHEKSECPLEEKQ